MGDQDNIKVAIRLRDKIERLFHHIMNHDVILLLFNNG